MFVWKTRNVRFSSHHKEKSIKNAAWICGGEFIEAESCDSLPVLWGLATLLPSGPAEVKTCKQMASWTQKAYCTSPRCRAKLCLLCVLPESHLEKSSPGRAWGPGS